MSITPTGRRFWLPRGVEPDLSDDGFLMDPEIKSVVGSPNSAVAIEEILDLPILILMGDAGTGKTTFLEAYENRYSPALANQDEFAWKIDLSDLFLNPSLFDHPFIERIRNGSKVHLLLDGFGECFYQFPNLPRSLGRFLASLPRQRLLVRIASRPGDWSPELEEELGRSWQCSPSVYHIAPLRRLDICREVEKRGLSVTDFMKQVADRNISSLAIRPITLQFLLASFEKQKALPSNRWELYLQGCVIFCDERREGLKRQRSFSPGQRLAVAARLAAMLAFCGRNALCTDGHHNLLLEGDIHIDELRGGTEQFRNETVDLGNPKAIAETLSTGLFRSAGRHRFNLSHQSFAEFLAAYYLLNKPISLSAIGELIFHQDQRGNVVPQLREVAAWLASKSLEVCRLILASDPRSLLIAGLELPEQGRAELGRSLLKHSDSGLFLDLETIRRVGQREEGNIFSYADAEKDLRTYLRNRSRHILARRLAVLIVELTRLRGLVPELVRVALNKDESYEIREAAVVATRRIGNDGDLTRLKGLLADESYDDPNDSIKGEVLFACWPSLLSAKELFRCLKWPKNLDFEGPYLEFLGGDFGSKLQRQDISLALDWAIERKKDAPHKLLFERAVSSIVLAAICFADDLKLYDPLADILMAWQTDLRHSRIGRTLMQAPNVRRSIVSLAVKKTPTRKGVVGLISSGLLIAADLDLLVDQFEPQGQLEDQEEIAVALKYFLPNTPWIEIECFDLIALLTTNCPVLEKYLQPIIGPVECPPSEAHIQLQRKSSEQGLPSQPDVTATIQHLLSRVDEEGGLVFEDIAIALQGDRSSRDELGRKLFLNWECLSVKDQDRTVESAASYIRRGSVLHWERFSSRAQDETVELEAVHIEPRPSGFLGDGWVSDGVLLGFWALQLLAIRKHPVLMCLGQDEWKGWMLCVFGNPFSEFLGDDAHVLILKAAYSSAPNSFFDAWEKFSEWFDVSDRLAPLWDQRIADTLHKRLKSNIGSGAFYRIANALVERSHRDALKYLESLVEQCPASGLVDIERSCAAAFQVLTRDHQRGFELAWPVVLRNPTFSEDFLGRLTSNVYVTGFCYEVIRKLNESQLASLHTFLEQNRPPHADVSFHRGLPGREHRLWFVSQLAISELGRRGTATALAELERIQKSLPAKSLTTILDQATRSVLRSTWKPHSPEEFLKLISGGSGENEKIQVTPRKPNSRIHKKPRKRHPNMVAIEEALKAIAQSRPKSHEEVFKLLGARNSPRPPKSGTFRAGWVDGFKNAPHAASTWLSKWWTKLGLPPFAPGPKN